jgi:hypothetical protein
LRMDSGQILLQQLVMTIGELRCRCCRDRSLHGIGNAVDEWEFSEIRQIYKHKLSSAEIDEALSCGCEVSRVLNYRRCCLLLRRRRWRAEEIEVIVRPRPDGDDITASKAFALGLE